MSKFNNFQLLSILFLNKIMIFDAKIKIIPINLPSKNYQRSLLFCSKIQIQNLEFFLKIEFLDTIRDFPTVCFCNVKKSKTSIIINSWKNDLRTLYFCSIIALENCDDRLTLLFLQNRREIWEKNLKFIQSHNSAAANGEFTHTVGMNEYGDWTTDEFVSFFNGYSNSSQQRDFDRDTVNDDDDVPDKVDWVNEGCVRFKQSLR